MVLTNPPFGGEEEKSIQANFPADKQTAETAWLFLQLVIRQLKDGGRCGIVVPNGLLFGDGVGARIKKQLLTECNLHTVVRLPDGVFEPYTAIPSNLLFFDKTGRTKEVWFYEIPPPEGRKKYSKTKPMRFEEFADCQAWWADRDGERARLARADRRHRGRATSTSTCATPTAPTTSRTARPPSCSPSSSRGAGDPQPARRSCRPRCRRDVRNTSESVTCCTWSGAASRSPDAEYDEIGIRSFGKGIFHKEPVYGPNSARSVSSGSSPAT